MTAIPTVTRFPIETGIAIPPRTPCTTRDPSTNRIEMPWRMLKVNQSFFVPNGKISTLGPQCTRWSNAIGAVFVYRQTIRSKDDPTIGVRIWRFS